MHDPFADSLLSISSFTHQLSGGARKVPYKKEGRSLDYFERPGQRRDE